MYDSTKTQEEEKLNTQSHTDENSKLEYSSTNEPIEDTPFHFVIEKYDTGERWAARLGDHLITPWKNDKEEVLYWLQENTYNVIMGMVGIAMAKVEQELKKIS